MKKSILCLLTGVALYPCIPAHALVHKRHRAYARTKSPVAVPASSATLLAGYRQQVSDQLKLISAGSDQIAQLSDGASNWNDQYQQQSSDDKKQVYDLMVQGADATAYAEAAEKSLAALGTPINAYQFQQWHLQLTDCKLHCAALQSLNPVPLEMKTIDQHLGVAAVQMEQTIAAYDEFLSTAPLNFDDLDTARKLQEQAIDSFGKVQTEFDAAGPVQKQYK